MTSRHWKIYHCEHLGLDFLSKNRNNNLYIYNVVIKGTYNVVIKFLAKYTIETF